MEKKIQKEMGRILAMFLLIGLVGGTAFSSQVLAEEEEAVADNEGVAGCNAVTVDTNMSFEEQQAICTNAEQFPSSSCAAGGHGTCSAPKTDGTLVDGNHCVCLSQAEEAVPPPVE